MEGVAESIQFFKTKGYKIALASSSASSLINVVLDKLNIRNEFEVVNSAEFLALGKPHPEVFIKTAKELNVAAINCLVIEDSFHGVLAGKAAVMQVIAIPEEKYYNDPRFSIANYNLKSLTELKTINFE
jgi:beta-phosphoglucomutase-like phosphatase (HAD superfamily)